MHLQFFISFIFFGFVLPCWAQGAGTIPIEAFAQLPSAASMRLSPEGDYIAMTAPHEGKTHLIIQRLDGENTVAIPPGGDADFAWFRWANNNRLVFSYAFTSKRGLVLVRETRLYGVDRDGQNFGPLVLPKKMRKTISRVARSTVTTQIQDDVIDWLPEDAEHFLLAIDSDMDGKDEVRKINVNTGKFKEISAGFRGIQNYQTDQSHNLRLGWGYDPVKRTQFNYIYFNPETSSWASVERSEWGNRNLFPIAFSDDPQIAFAGGPDKAGRFGIYKVNLSKGTVLETVFSNDKVDYDHLIYDPATKTPVGVQFTVDKTEFFYWDKDFEKLQANIDKALPDTVNRIVSRIPEQKKYLIFSTSDVEPGVYYFLDMKQKKMEFISETMPGLSPDNLATTTPIHYEARDGLEIPAYITLPRSGPRKNLPFVIFPHGGPKARDAKRFDYFSQFFASRGYGVLQPNFRGSDGYGQKFANLGKRQWGGTMQDDVTDGVQYLIDQGIADPARICIVGASYGGYAAMMGAIKTPDLYQCAASINGVLNLMILISDDKDYIGGKAWIKSMGLTGEKATTVSPIHQAQKIKIPALIIQAKDDFRVPYKHAVGMVDKLKQYDKDVQMVTLKTGDHNLDTAESRIQTLQALETFLNQHLNKK